MRTAQGIDHALCRQSSQGPCKQDEVNALRRKRQLFETDWARIHMWNRGGKLGDGVGVGIDGEDRFGGVRISPRQAAVSATNFNNSARCERRNHRPERRDFVAFRVFINRHVIFSRCWLGVATYLHLKYSRVPAAAMCSTAATGFRPWKYHSGPVKRF